MGSDERENVLSSDTAGMLWPHAVLTTSLIKAEERTRCSWDWVKWYHCIYGYCASSEVERNTNLYFISEKLSATYVCMWERETRSTGAMSREDVGDKVVEQRWRMHNNGIFEMSLYHQHFNVFLRRKKNGERDSYSHSNEVDNIRVQLDVYCQWGFVDSDVVF